MKQFLAIILALLLVICFAIPTVLAEETTTVLLRALSEYSWKLPEDHSFSEATGDGGKSIGKVEVGDLFLEVDEYVTVELEALPLKAASGYAMSYTVKFEPDAQISEGGEWDVTVVITNSAWRAVPPGTYNGELKFKLVSSVNGTVYEGVTNIKAVKTDPGIGPTGDSTVLLPALIIFDVSTVLTVVFFILNRRRRRKKAR